LRVVKLNNIKISMGIKVKKTQSGQALLLVLLAMAAILTIVLSVASRSVTDVSVTSSEENALRAFSAAEAGIEKALLTGQSSGGYEVSADPNDDTVTYASEILANPEGVAFNYPSLLYPGESATFWFVGRDSNGNFSCTNGCTYGVGQLKDLCWGYYPISSNYPVQSKRPAVSLSVYYDPTGNTINSGNFSGVKVKRIAVDGYNSGSVSLRSPTNGFLGYKSSGGTCQIGGKKYGFKYTNINFGSDLGIPSSCFNTPGCLLMAKVRVYYNDASKPEQVALDLPGGTVNGFPAQGNMIVSTGAAGESTRKVNVFQSFSEAPSLFDAAVFSLGDFSK